MRDPCTWQTYIFGSAPNATDITDKGYTGQQQLDALGLVHMNGRVQDPYTGRFVSADPTVPDPFYSQSFNRFAYVYNNPMNLVDPSGFAPDMTIDWFTWNPKITDPYWVSCPPSGCIVSTDTGQSAAAPSDQPPVILGKIEVTGTKPPSQTVPKSVMTQTVHCASNSCTDDGRAKTGYGSTSKVPGSGDMCISGECGNGVHATMDSTDGATTWNGGFSNNDANPPIGFLGEIPIPAKQPKVIMFPGIAGGTGTKAGPGATCTGSLGCTSDEHQPPMEGIEPSCPECAVFAGLKAIGIIKLLGPAIVGALRQSQIELPGDIAGTLTRIRNGGLLKQFRNDGSVFRNDEGKLPAKPMGYYREYVHPTPGFPGPGPQRIVTGDGGEIYYTPDHYDSFIPIQN